MKEILVSGNPTKDFERLGVNPKLTYGNKNTEYRVYEVSEGDFKILCDEPDFEEVEGTWKDCGWRYCEGSNLESPSDDIFINGKKIIGWVNKDDENDEWNGFSNYIPIYDNLLNYLCEEKGCSVFRNVCALTVDLAKYNNMKLSELFKIYQG